MDPKDHWITPEEQTKLAEYLKTQGVEADIQEHVEEAIQAIHRLHGTKQVVFGTSRWHRFQTVTLPRWLHHLGLHEYIPTYAYDSRTGSVKLEGSVCWICRKKAGS